MVYLTKPLSVIIFLLAVQCQARFNRTRVSSSIASKTATAITASQTATILNATIGDCFLTVPNDPLTAKGLSTPFLLQPPCSMSVATQQAFAEAAVFDPATGAISIYHPLVSDANAAPAAPPVVPVLPAGAIVALWFGFNGGNLQLLDTNGKDTNNSPGLKKIDCVNGLPGSPGDVFGQVSWCNAEVWFAAANAGVASGKTVIPDLGVDKLGNPCPTSRSFEITDACPSDNVPTQYILTPDGKTAQDTNANEAALKNGTVINNASDEALLTNILDPLLGCTPFLAPSLTNPGAKVPALALSEMQAAAKQKAPIGLVPLNNPDCLLTSDGNVSVDKTNAYRLGVNQPLVAPGDASGALLPYCQNMVAVAPSFLKGFETEFSGQASPAPDVGNNLFTFLAARYLTSLQQLTCPPSAIPVQPVVCKKDPNGVATSCTITLQNTNGTTVVGGVVSSGKTSSSSSKSATIISSVKASVASASSKAASSVKDSIASTKTNANTVLATEASSLKAPLRSTTSSKHTITSAGAKAVTTLAPTSIALATSTAAAITTTKARKTKTVIVEIITFFPCTPSLGSPPPSVLLSPNSTATTPSFIVLTEIFISLPRAAARACTHQFNHCARLAGSAFQGTDCLAQMNACVGVASTQSQTATTPGTLVVSATVPASASTGEAVVSGGAGQVVATGITEGSADCTAVTVTVSVPMGVSAPFPTGTTGAMMKRHDHMHVHLKRKDLGRF